MINPHQMTDPAAVREFVFAGNARLTLVSRKTGARFTYRVRAPRDERDNQGPAAFFVSVLNGPDNEGDYVYLGFYRKSGGYEHGKKSRIGEFADSALAWRWFDKYALSLNKLPEALEVWHVGACGRCGRALTVPESIARGLGPECAGRV